MGDTPQTVTTTRAPTVINSWLGKGRIIMVTNAPNDMMISVHNALLADQVQPVSEWAQGATCKPLAKISNIFVREYFLDVQQIDRH